MSAPIIDIVNDEDAAAASLLKSTNPSGNKKLILFFWAEWHAPSNSGGLFDTVVRTLAEQNADGSVQFYRVLAEGAPKLSRKHNVNAVPTFLFILANGAVIDRIDGGEDVASVTQFYSKLVSTVSSSSNQNQSQKVEQQHQEETKEQTPQETLNERIRSLISFSPVILFLKGTPSSPRCGFSRQAVELLTSSNLSFGYFDILEDDEVRQGLKSYSDWPTYPQLYVRGELVGGLDIMKEMMEEEGGLVQELELGEYLIKNGSSPFLAATEQRREQENTEEESSMPLNEKLKQLVNRHHIMLFMKGIPSSPKCGFSRQIVEILDSLHVSYDAFNILEDDEVRQGLKAYSDWPTYPQLYVEGDLVGGLDIVKELMEGGDLEDTLKGSAVDQRREQEHMEEESSMPLNEKLKQLVNRHHIMLFMKGIPSSPKCGFSRQIVEILDSLNVSYDAFNILEDDEVRQGLKAYSDWPTYPQLYVEGDLLGGLDIVKELMEGGDLEDTLKGSAAEQQREEENMEEEVSMPLNEKLKQLVSRHHIMLFMKGIPSSPKCGFSRQIVEILDSLNVSYDAFNILEDDEVRQGLKAYSDWPTYPQLYVKGDLLGGLDIVKELMEGGDLEDTLKGSGED